MDLYPFFKTLSELILTLTRKIDGAIEAGKVEDAKKMMASARTLHKAKKEIANAIHDKSDAALLSKETQTVLEALGMPSLQPKLPIDPKKEMERAGLPPVKEIKIKDKDEDEYPTRYYTTPEALKKPVPYTPVKEMPSEELATPEKDLLLAPLENKLRRLFPLVEEAMSKGDKKMAEGLIEYIRAITEARKEIADAVNLSMLSAKTKSVLDMVGVRHPKKAMKKDVLEKLVSVANYLDGRGLHKDADEIDAMLKRF